MKHLKIVLASLVILEALWSAELTDPREGAGGIVAAPGFYIVLGAPKGWIFESQTALEMVGAPVAIYPLESDMTNAAAMIMVNFLPLQGMSFELWMENDANQVKENFPGIEVTDYTPFLTADSMSAAVRGIAPGNSSYDLYERAAYIPYKDYVVIVWLSAQKEEDLKKSLTVLEYVISGIHILSQEELLKLRENRPEP